jgi:hypothetical protein
LRARLTASVAAVVLIAVAVAFTVVYRSTDSQLSAEIDRSVRGNAVQLAHAITEKRSASPQSVLATATAISTTAATLAVSRARKLVAMPRRLRSRPRRSGNRPT